MTQLETLEAATLQLTPAERGHLAECLLASLKSDDGILAEWVVEAETRLDAFKRVIATALNHHDVLRLANKVGLNRGDSNSCRSTGRILRLRPLRE